MTEDEFTRAGDLISNDGEGDDPNTVILYPGETANSETYDDLCEELSPWQDDDLKEAQETIRALELVREYWITRCKEAETAYETLRKEVWLNKPVGHPELREAGLKIQVNDLEWRNENLRVALDKQFEQQYQAEQKAACSDSKNRVYLEPQWPGEK